jgi:3'-5' exoribonuclease
MLLSHHGKPEYGAAVVPKLLEAELLHFIDNIDAKVELCRELFDKIPLNTFTEKHFALDNRAFYKHYELSTGIISAAGPV